jgi:hypothetical protein
MGEMNGSMVNIAIPVQLEKWVVAYKNVTKDEYDFYLKDFSLSRIRIKASKVKRERKYFAVSNYKLKYHSTDNRFTVPYALSDDAITAVFSCLESMINRGEVFSFETNSAYPGTPIVK